MQIRASSVSVAKRAYKLARKEGWQLDADGCFGIEATVSYLLFLEKRIIDSKIKHSTMIGYLSCLQDFHYSNNINWGARVLKSFPVQQALRNKARNPLIPTQHSTQDDEVTLADLLEFCNGLGNQY
jgi:hypothetical protein